MLCLPGKAGTGNLMSYPIKYDHKILNDCAWQSICQALFFIRNSASFLIVTYGKLLILAENSAVDEYLINKKEPDNRFFCTIAKNNSAPGNIDRELVHLATTADLKKIKL